MKLSTRISPQFMTTHLRTVQSYSGLQKSCLPVLQVTTAAHPPSAITYSQFNWLVFKISAAFRSHMTAISDVFASFQKKHSHTEEWIQLTTMYFLNNCDNSFSCG